MAEPSMDPGYLLQALRSFLGAAALTPAGGSEGGAPAAAAALPNKDGEALGWEEAGCAVWDAAALPDDAAFLSQHGALAMLPPLLEATAAQEQWRALEIGLGTLGNLACHPAPKAALLAQPGLPDLLLSRLLWVDDAAALAELCRCLASLLGGSDRQAADAWWALVMQEESLGRLAWMVECTLNPTLLHRALNLLCTLVAAAAAARSAAGPERQLVPRLLALDLMPLLASVLHGWVVRLRAEQQLFAAAGGGSQPAAAPSPATAVAAGASPAPVIAAPAPGSPAQWDEKVVAAAEVTEEGALEALGLLEALVADPVGEASANASVSVKEGLLRLVAESANRGMRAASTELLAGLEGTGPLLVQHPQAVVALLARLQAGDGAKRPRSGEVGGAAPGLTEAAVEVEAAWALLSALAQALSTPPSGAQGGGDGDGSGSGGQAAGDAAPAEEAVLGVLAEHADVLCGDWAASSAALGAHQAYVLRRLAQQLAPRLGEEAAAQLHAAVRAAVQG